MASALGTLTIVEGVKDPVGPLFVDRCTLTGDADYLTGGTVGLLAALRAAKAMPDLEIVSLQGEGDNGDFRLEYDHDADGVIVRILDTGVEALLHANHGGKTWGLTIVSH